jgi:hypothetical protein
MNTKQWLLLGVIVGTAIGGLSGVALGVLNAQEAFAAEERRARPARAAIYRRPESETEPQAA